MEKRKFTIKGMHCAACAAAIERAVKKLEGCEDAYVNFAAGELAFSGTSGDEEILKAIAKAGFSGEKIAREEITCKNNVQDNNEAKKSFADLLIVWIFGVILVLAMHLFLMPPLVQFLLLLPVLYGGRQFFTGGIPALLRGRPDMNSLIGCGVTAGIIYSFFSLLTMKTCHLHFDSAAMIIMLVMTGKYLEGSSRRKAAAALKELMALVPESAIEILKDGSERKIPFSEILPGQKFKVLPGAKIPADGKVVSGNSCCDESMFTGESLPVTKTPGSSVSGGTVNLENLLIMESLSSSGNSMVAQIIAAVKEALGSRAPIARIADKVSGFFVWGVLAIALVTFLVHLALGHGSTAALSHALGVMVIACPCSLGLATPIALICGIGRGAKSGILIKNGAVMEALAKIKVVVFDKTGTLTTGEFSILRTEVLHERWNADMLLAVSAALESNTSHPLGKAVLAEAEKLHIELPPVNTPETIPGQGVKGVFGGKCYELGRENGNSDNPEGASSMLLKENGVPVGRILLRDTVRSEAAEAVKALRQKGLRVEMITGDNQGAASAVAAQIEVDGFSAGVLPAEKSAMIQELRSRYGAVAMVGDGINDAPALAASDVGIAIGSGTAVAIETADAVVISNNLKNIPAAFGLSCRTMRIIKQNLFWAFAYNAIGIPLAAGVFDTLLPFAHVTPVFCAAAMGLSSVTVVLNALRLRNYKFSTAAPNLR